MKVRDTMMPDVCMATPGDTIQQAAQLMASHDIGILPVASDDRLVGMISDRDIAVRAIAKGSGPNAKVGDVMSEGVKYCFDDQDIEEVTRNMGDLQVRRLPVLNRSKRLVGILSLGDVALASTTDSSVDQALSAVSRPSGQHNQTNPI